MSDESHAIPSHPDRPSSAGGPVDGPVPRYILTGRWLGIAAPWPGIIGIMGIHIGVWAPMAGFALFQLTLLLGLVTFVLGVIGVVRSSGGKARNRAIQSCGYGGVIVLVLVYSIAPGVSLPPINDISTDLERPPQFKVMRNARGNLKRDMSFPAEFAAQIREAYPDLVGPIRIDAPPEVAFTRAMVAAESLGWEIGARLPQFGKIEGSDTSKLFRFVDDISIRVEPAPNTDQMSILDIRSKSRDGRGDLGANAARIRAFKEALKAAS